MNTLSTSNSSFPNALPNGTTLRNGDFTIDGVLGQGGSGITYRAADSSLNRIAALKEFFPEGAKRSGKNVVSVNPNDTDFQNARERFLEEARTLAQFNHPNIVNAYTIFEENNTAYMVMEYVAGDSLSSLVEKRGALSPEAAIPIVGQIGAALEVVHRAGMLHLDVKPDNAVVDASTPALRVVLLDFGLTRKLETVSSYGTARLDDLARFGTPGYAPPEQYSQRAQTGVTTDVYALAATLYFLVTGQTPPDSIHRASGEDLPDARSFSRAVSDSVAEAIARGMALDPKQRPQNVRAFLDLLDTSAAPQRSTPPAPPAPAPRPVQTTDEEEVNQELDETASEILDQLFGGHDPFSPPPPRRRLRPFPRPMQLPQPRPPQRPQNDPFQQPTLRGFPGCNCGCGCLVIILMTLFFLLNFFGALVNGVSF